MYSDNTLQVNLLIKSFLSVIEQEKVHNIEVEIQSEVAFLIKTKIEKYSTNPMTDKMNTKINPKTTGRFRQCTVLLDYEITW